VGQKGTRVNTIISELGGEKIDVIEWSKDTGQLISNALSPAKILDVEINEKTKEAEVMVDESQLSLAIGRAGQNVRLAAKLTGWKLDIRSREGKSVATANEEGEVEPIDMPVAQVIMMDLQNSDMFSDSIFKLVFDEYLAALGKGEVLAEQYFVHHENEAVAKVVINILHPNFEMSAKWEEKHKIICSLESNNPLVLRKSVQESVLKLRSKCIQQNIIQVRDELKSSSSEEELLELMQQLQELMNLRNQIENMYGRVIS